MKTLKLAVLAVAMCCSSLIAAGSAAAADGGHGALVSAESGALNGFVAVIQHGGSSQAVVVSVVGLAPDTTYKITGRSIGCAGTPAPANRTFTRSVTSDSNGAIIGSFSVAASVQIATAWINDVDDFCLFVVRGEEPTDAQPANAGVGRMRHPDVNRSAAVLMNTTPNGNQRIRVVADGLNPDHEYTATSTSRACGKSVSSSQSFFTVALEDVTITSFTSHTLPATDGIYATLKSVRIKDITNGQSWGCVPVMVIAVSHE